MSASGAMTTPQVSQGLLDVASQVLEMAKAEGATEADVLASNSKDFEVKVADGKIVTLTQAGSKALGLRVFVDTRMGFCTTSDFRAESLRHAVQRAVAMAKESAPDPHNGLAEAEPGYMEPDQSLELYDPAVAAMPAEEKIAWAHALEDAARAADPRITRVRDCGVASGDAESVFATSKGVSRGIRGSGITLWSNPLAVQDGELQTEMWWDAATYLEDLDSPEAIGKCAGERAARMLGAKPVKTQSVPVIFEPQIAIGVIGGILGAINGDMVYKKASFLGDKLGEQIASSKVSLVDDPLVPRGPASTPFDGEGLRTYKKRLIDHGRLTTFLYDTYTARKAGTKPTASARRGYSSAPSAGCFNLYVEKGTDPVEEILRSADRALLVTRGMGRGLNTVSGEYSRGANGLWLEKGEVVHAVQEVTIAGDMLKILQNIDRVGDDFSMRGSRGAPTLRVANMTVSGG